MDTRALQRTLFRCQADEAFAARLLAGDEEAWATTDLGPEERALFADLDPAALSADPGGKRRTQILGNVASEYTTSLAALAHEGRADVLERFLESEEFHGALRRDGRLPLAFGDYLERRAREEGRADRGALVRLERGLATLRREARGATPIPNPHPPGEDATTPPTVTDSPPKALRLATTARLLTLPAGTHERAQAWRLSLEGLPAPDPAPAPEGAAEEVLLLHAVEDPGPHRLADVRVELLAPPADRLLSDPELLASPAARAAFATAQGATAADVEAFLGEFVAEGLLEPAG